MSGIRRKKWMTLLVSGSVLPLFGSCLPENYFALSARAVVVTLADSVLAGAVSPIFDAFGFDDGSTGTDGTGDSNISGDAPR